MRPVLGLSVAFCLCACAQTIESEHIIPTAPPQRSTNMAHEDIANAKDALLYALPQRLVNLKITEKTADDVKKLEKDFKKAAEAKGEADGALEAAKAKLKAFDDAGKPDGVSAAAHTAARQVIEKEVGTAHRDAIQKKKEYDTAKTKLLSGVTKPGEGLTHFDVKLSLMAPTPDPAFMFQARFRHGITRDDDFKITTTTAGLLSSSDVVAEDQSAEIIVNLASILSGFGTSGAGVAGLRETFLTTKGLTPPQKPVKSCTLPKPMSLDMIFDVTDTTKVKKINELLEDCAVPINFSVVSPVTKAVPGKTFSPYEAHYGKASKIYQPGDYPAKPKNNPYDGLLYRRPVPYIIEVNNGFFSKKDSEHQVALQSQLVMLPQGGPIAAIPYIAAPFTKSVTNVVFENGQPKEWHVNRPSELAAIFRIPVAMAKALVQIPAELVQLKVDLTNNQTALLEAQKNYICALEAVQKAEGKEPIGGCAAASE